ncbi:OmpA family protein [Hymenobacter sp.]|uniref:OmpA family protein n=1 Tax=Hymenobacter sp. TaxID=1898978 RepID=UPI00286D1905|nr:OmpA family protein [Hymenobacter sp.]
MKNELVETVDVCFSATLISQLSAQVNEPESKVEQALSGAVALLLDELLSQAARGVAPAKVLLLARKAHAGHALAQLTGAPGANWYERDTNLLLVLLGERYGNALHRVATQAAVQPAAAEALLHVAATGTLGLLGRAAAEEDPSPAQFVAWLHRQKEAVGSAMLPTPGFATATGPDPDSLVAAPAARNGFAPMRMARREEPGLAAAVRYATLRRLVPGALVLLAGTLGYFFGHYGTSAPSGLPARPAPTPVVTVASVTAPGTAAAAYTSPEEAHPAAPAPVAAAPAASASVAPAAVVPAPVAAALAAPPAPVVSVKAPPAPVLAAARAAPAPAVAPKPAGAVSPPAEPRPAGERRAGPAPRMDLPPGRYDAVRDTYLYDTGRSINLTLTGGNTQKVGVYSTENRLYKFLSTPAMQVDSVNRTKDWIAFDRVQFVPGQATLTPESMPQLLNIARILRSFPNAVVKIGGYTDSTGLVEPNYNLSGARARTVMMTLANLGVRLYGLHAQGFGEKFFLVPNTTPASRALNRRVSIRVLKK